MTPPQAFLPGILREEKRRLTASIKIKVWLSASVAAFTLASCLMALATGHYKIALMDFLLTALNAWAGCASWGNGQLALREFNTTWRPL